MRKLSEPQLEALTDLAQRIGACRPWDDQVRTYEALCRKGLAVWKYADPGVDGGYYATDEGKKYAKDKLTT